MTERDPQGDKIRSYQRDGRNADGESDKGSRRAIRFRKAWVNRTYRRTLRSALQSERDANERVGGVVRKSWQKFPDVPLADWIAYRSPPSRLRDEAVRRNRRRRR